MQFQKQLYNLTVFCSSKNNLAPRFYHEVNELVSNLNTNKFSIVYGGGSTGLMGTVRSSWLNSNGKIITSNIKKFVEPGIPDDFVFDEIDDRQKKLVELGDGYLVLPGGYGTHFEALEVMTKNDIGEASKPIFILNSNGIFDDLVSHINKLISNGFVTRDLEKIKVFVSSNPLELANLINSYNF
jgi:uncharacterized protein (TIGR00730 family)